MNTCIIKKKGLLCNNDDRRTWKGGVDYDYAIQQSFILEFTQMVIWIKS